MSFWEKLMTAQTARFILALLALGCAAYDANKLINLGEKDAGQAAVFAAGQLFALATMAFGYYFGSTARGDERPIETQIVNEKSNPVPTEPADDAGERK
jgi:hypothetical protein